MSVSHPASDHNDPILRRLRRKLEIMYEDSKKQTGCLKYDLEECLALLDLKERAAT